MNRQKVVCDNESQEGRTRTGQEVQFWGSISFLTCFSFSCQADTGFNLKSSDSQKFLIFLCGDLWWQQLSNLWPRLDSAGRSATSPYQCVFCVTSCFLAAASHSSSPAPFRTIPGAELVVLTTAGCGVTSSYVATRWPEGRSAASRSTDWLKGHLFQNVELLCNCGK